MVDCGIWWFVCEVGVTSLLVALTVLVFMVTFKGVCFRFVFGLTFGLVGMLWLFTFLFCWVNVCVGVVIDYVWVLWLWLVMLLCV